MLGSTSSPELLLGAFKLLQHLGHGGGGEVWLGVHQGEDIAVAVKVMTDEGAKSEAFRSRFVDEVRAVTRLDHPGIVTIIDHGRVDAETAASSSLPEASPFLVMELARHGTLPNLEPLRDYGELRRALLALLDALAHAHARGVIHRDLKPGNVLVTTGDRAQPGLKLTDFGIAYALERSPAEAVRGSLRVRAGTPSYMAPEQIRGDLHNQGPWTDLYALGCLAFRLATGHPPFTSTGDVDQVLQAHLHAVVPPLTSRLSVPPGFHDWLRVLLSKTPWQRFQCCADAAQALRRLGWPVADAPTAPHEKSDGSSRFTNEDAMTLTLPDHALASSTVVEPPDSDHHGPEEDEPGPPLRPLITPVPQSWRHRDPPPKPLRLQGAGLGLFGLRPIPLVGRERERDTIWEVLCRVAAQQRIEVVVLRGPAGVGKSRLAEWASQRAHELGVAEVMRATHSSFPSQAEGLPRMLAQSLRCLDLPPRRMRRQVKHILRAYEGERLEPADERFLVHALTALMSPLTPGASASTVAAVQFGHQVERYAVIHRLLSLKCRHRPMLIWLDDVQWGRESLGLVSYLLERAEAVPALALLTVRDESLTDRPLEQELLAEIEAEAVTLELGPLTAEEQLELVRGMLGLEPELAHQVERRTDGNPLFAVQLVGDWVERRALEVGPEGFRLRPGERAELPDDIHQVWSRRLERLTGRFDEASARQALELAAAMGSDVDSDEWTAACDLAGWPVPDGVAEAMVELRLALRSDHGWSFAHGMMRESLERTARAEGRWADHHLACARALEPTSPPATGPQAERIALHLLEAGEQEEALAPLLRASDHHQRLGNFDRALELLRRRDLSLTELGLAEDDPRRTAGALLAARCHYKQASFDEAEGLLDSVEATFDGQEPAADRATARRIRAQITRMRGDMRGALELAEAARADFTQAGDELAASECDLIMARLHLESTGAHRRGLKLARRAYQHFLEANERNKLAEGAYITGHLHLALGDVDAAINAAVEAHQLYESEGNRFGVAACANFRGELARHQRSFDEAAERYLEAVTILESMGSKATFVPRLNLALTQVQRGAFDEAAPLLLALRREGHEGKDAVLCYVHYSLMVCLAVDQRWDAWDEQYQAASGYRPDTGRVDQDLALLARQAGDLAAAAGELERARKARALAREHWRALDRPDMLEPDD